MVRSTDPAVTPPDEPAVMPSFPATARGERTTSQLGLWLGVAFSICFVTGLISHGIQHPPSWFAWPSRPVNLYRVTQGLHVSTGLACVPLLAAKLWSVYPKLFRWPPVRGLVDGLERGSIAVLVASALFQVVTGILNISRWYRPMHFFFPSAHHWTAWLAMGALALHVAVQLPVIRRGLARVDPAAPRPDNSGGLSRRGLLTATGAAAATITIATAGQTFRPLSPLSLLAPRRPDLGPQGLPVNASAVGSGVVAAASDPAYRLVIRAPGREVRLSLAELQALPHTTASLPISCVEGWSATATWTGVPVAELIRLVGVDHPARVLVESLQRDGLYRACLLSGSFLSDPFTLLALRLHGQPLALDHGYPCRLIAPNRPGVLQTKWVGSLTVTPR